MYCRFTYFLWCRLALINLVLFVKSASENVVISVFNTSILIPSGFCTAMGSTNWELHENSQICCCLGARSHRLLWMLRTPTPKDSKPQGSKARPCRTVLAPFWHTKILSSQGLHRGFNSFMMNVMNVIMSRWLWSWALALVLQFQPCAQKPKLHRNADLFATFSRAGPAYPQLRATEHAVLELIWSSLSVLSVNSLEIGTHDFHYRINISGQWSDLALHLVTE